MTNEERQAAKDALTAILQARAITRLGQSAGPGGMPTPPPGAEIDIDIDPNLLDPEVDMPEGDDSSIKINDPDNVLKDKKQNQKQGAKSKKGGQSGGGNSNPGNPGGSSSSGSSSSDSDSGEDTPDKQGDTSGSKSDKGDKGDKGTNGDNGEESGNGSNEEENGGTGKADNDESADYAAAWNEIIDRYDNDEITDAELQRLINEIGRGNIDSI